MTDFTLAHKRKAQGRIEAYLYFFLNLGARCIWVVTTTSRSLWPRGRDIVPVLEEAGWVPGPIWTCAKNLAPIGVRSPDRPDGSDSLNRLSHSGPNFEVGRWNGDTKEDRCKENIQFLRKISFVPKMRKEVLDFLQNIRIIQQNQSNSYSFLHNKNGHIIFSSDKVTSA